jgi:hypothetical protein
VCVCVCVCRAVDWHMSLRGVVQWRGCSECQSGCCEPQRELFVRMTAALLCNVTHKPFQRGAVQQYGQCPRQRRAGTD